MIEAPCQEGYLVWEAEVVHLSSVRWAHINHDGKSHIDAEATWARVGLHPLRRYPPCRAWSGLPRIFVRTGGWPILPVGAIQKKGHAKRIPLGSFAIGVAHDPSPLS